ncbi:hypothetical protein BKA59DRAFT_549235 [Fusarium tricinctum]|uniref:Ankyrin repeat protein n=1 Tax=Fusarium tricinctum TaxID=61284 RepID=A0A8K0W877_9HYPO|nr:hypothetical protein BKA59DRAFT_549235 [Fusarium tricinctum]
MSHLRHDTFLLLLLATGCRADPGDDFSNNLFSDLAPLLALFGERVTMQFLSQSMGWLDCVILAMGPLGIITTIVSAIRVDGPPWLKAIIGRSRENLSAAEMELMSSTSDETCELWNGSDVVRCQGVAPVTEFICLVPKERWKGIERIRFVDLSEAIDEGLVHKQDSNAPGTLDRLWTHCNWPLWGRRSEPAILRNMLRRNWSLPTPADEEASTSIPLDNIRPEDSSHSSPVQPPSILAENVSEMVVLRNTSTQAPNITLNRNHKATEGQLLVAAGFGIILQLAVLVYFAFITYYPTLKFKKNGKDIVGYAFPLASGGTIFLVLGMLLCAHVVDHSTKEERYEPSKDYKMRMIWLQEKQTISDQFFHSFALFPRRFTQVITTSQREKKGIAREEGEQEASMSSGLEDKVRKGYSTVRQRVRPLRVSQTEKLIDLEKQESASINLCVIAALVCLTGFLIQFIGLRAMHWSASVGQLVAVIIMTIIRAWIRRGFTARMDDRELRNGFELDGLALALGDPDLDNSPGSIADEKGVDFGLSKKRTWAVEINHDEKSYPFIRQPDHNNTQHTNTGALKSGLVVNRGTNEAQQTLDIRRHLARLSQWQGPASRAANSLARAIEATMNTLCPRPNTESLTWKWTIRVAIREKDSFTKSHPVELHLSHKSGPWKCRIDELDSVLSLWLCSIDEARGEPVNKIQRPSKNDDDEWIRKKTSWDEGGLVIFGEYCKQLEQALEWWMPVDAPKVSTIDKKTKEIRFESWRVIGTESSYATQISASRSNQAPEESGEEPVEDTTPATKSPRQFLSIEVNDGLEQVYARHIFHSFISAAAAKMDSPIDDHSDMETTSNIIPGEWSNLRFRGKNLTRLAGAIRDSGLMDLNQAYLTLIPPLHAKARLGELDSVIEAVLTQAKQYQRLLNWKAAGKAYTPLLDLVKDLHPDSYTFRKVVALADDYVRTLETLPTDPEIHRDELYPQAAAVMETLLSILDRDIYKGIRNDLQILHRFQQEPHRYQQGSDGATVEVSSCNFTKLHSHAATPDATDWEGILIRGKAYYKKLAKVQSNARRVSDGPFTQANDQDILGWTPHHYVAARKDIEAQSWIDELVRKQADVNTVDIRHRTALHYAILNWNPRSFEALLEAGADITITGVDGMTPLHCAALTNSGYMVESLFSHSRQAVDQFARDNYGRVPIHLAALEGTTDLIKHFQASIETKDPRGRTALHLATLSGHLETITELARCKASLNAPYMPFRGGEEVTALVWAVIMGKTEVVQRLIEAGADVNRKDYGRTPLHHASYYGYADIVGVLIVHGALINPTDHSRQTPLHLAASTGQLEVIRRLIEATGIGLNIARRDMKLAVQLAAEKGYFEIVKLLVRKGAIIDNKTTLLVAGGVKKKATEELTQHVDREDEETGAASCKKSYRKAFDQQDLSLWQAWQSYSEEDGGDIIWEGLIRRLLLSYRE